MRTTTAGTFVTSGMATGVLAAALTGCSGTSAPHPTAQASSARPVAARPLPVSSSPSPTAQDTGTAPNGFNVRVTAGHPVQIGAPSVDGLGGKFFVDCNGARGHFVLTAKDGVTFRFSCTVDGVSEGTFVSPKETLLTASTTDPGTMILAWRLVYQGH